MAWADMVRSCTFWNSYITVASWPGCTCTMGCAGLKSHSPWALASNTTVMVRLKSTWLFAAAADPPGTCFSPSARMLMPVSSQMCLYSGISAYPKANMPAATTASLRTIFRFSPRKAISASQEHELGDETEEEHERDRGQDQAQSHVGLPALLVVHRGAQCTPAGFSGCTRASSTRVAVGSRRGGVSKVWKGAGEGTSHSRPSAPLPSGSFHGRCGATAPLPRMQGSTTNRKK